MHPLLFPPCIQTKRHMWHIIWNERKKNVFWESFTDKWRSSLVIFPKLMAFLINLNFSTRCWLQQQPGLVAINVSFTQILLVRGISVYRQARRDVTGIQMWMPSSYIVRFWSLFKDKLKCLDEGKRKMFLKWYAYTWWQYNFLLSLRHLNTC